MEERPGVLASGVPVRPAFPCPRWPRVIEVPAAFPVPAAVPGVHR
jgi:hypothetical protein